MISFGHGVALGPLREKNLWRYFNERNNRDVWRWCRQFDVLTEHGHESWFQHVQGTPKIRMYEVLRDFDELVGVCGLTDIDHVNQRAEFSLYVFKSFQERGLGKAALKTLVSHGFQNLNLNMIWGETFYDNNAASMFERIGFEQEGTRKNFYFRDGRFIDAKLYSVSREKWKSLYQFSS